LPQSLAVWIAFGTNEYVEKIASAQEPALTLLFGHQEEHPMKK